MITHFDNCDYDAELPAHITQYFVERKCSKIYDALNEKLNWQEYLRGVDLGCGVGHHVDGLFLIGELPSYICGVDITEHFIRLARLAYPDRFKQFRKYGFLQSDICNIFWCDESVYDFAYTINVLHHMGDKHDQIKAIKEAHRILKKGGLFIIMEMNFRNPLIGFYVKYLFRYIRNIDQGSECWFDPKLLKQVPGFKLIKKEYFTFTPDFCPKWLLPLFRRIDEWTDGKWISRFGAHVMYVLEKV